MQYGPLFRIECLHAYFGGPCRSLTLVPTDDCRHLMARYRMLFREVLGGGAVYCPQQSPPDLLKEFDETTAFTFALISNDPLFTNYTESGSGGLDPGESIFYFDNKNDIQGPVLGQTRQLLHQPGHMLGVPVRTKVSKVARRTSAAGNSFTVLEPLGKQAILQGTFPPETNSAQLDLRSFPEGLYWLQVGDDTPQPFYLSDEPSARRWGVVHIYAGGIRQASELPAACTTIDSNGVTHPKTFTIALESRKTIWRYYVMPSSNQAGFGDYQVVPGGKKPPDANSLADGDPQFRLLPGTTPIEGRAAWVFESQKAIPFLLSPAKSFALSLRPNKNGQSGQRTIRLPYAQPASLTKGGTEPERMCSEIFVYL